MILIIEDHRDFAATLRRNLEGEGYEVAIANSGPDGITQGERHRPELIVLDLMLPGLNGYTVLQRLRDRGSTCPILVLTAIRDEDDKLRAFALGADDYLVKTAGRREMVARVRALLRRAGSASGKPVRVFVGDLLIDLGARQVSRSGVPIPLRHKLFELLAAFVRHRGRVVTREELLREVWGYATGIESRTVESHLATLRKELGDDSQSPQYITTVRGSGYRLDATDASGSGNHTD